MDRKWLVVASVVAVFGLGVGVGLRLARPKPVTATLLFASPPAPSVKPDAAAETTRPTSPPSAPEGTPISGVVLDAPAPGGKYAVIVNDFCDERQAGAAELEGCSQPATVYVQPSGASPQTICFAAKVKSCQRIRVLSRVQIANAPDATDAPCSESSAQEPEATTQYVSPASCPADEPAPWVDAQRGLYDLGCNLSKPPSFRFRLCLDQLEAALTGASEVSSGR